MKKNVLIECIDDAPINPVVSEIAIDEFSIEIVGPADAVRRMTGWLQYSLKKDDYRELVVPMLRPTNKVQYPLIGEEVWRISVSIEKVP